MELHTLDTEFAMAQAHDDAVGGFGGDFQVARKRFAVDDERMVARGGKWFWEIFENPAAIVLDFAGFAVHQFLRADDPAAEGRADSLMAQAHSENWNLAGKALDQRDADASFLRGARARGDDDALGTHGGNFVERDLIVAANIQFLTQLAEILGEVVGERIVVVEEQNHVALIF